MDKRKEIRSTMDVVMEILKKDKKCRDSDTKLFLEVAKAFNPDVKYLSFAEVFNEFNKYGIPSTETVRRTRQKLQEKYPELRPGEVVEDFRAENEQIFRREFGNG